jgi:hypothetical protein
MSTNLVGDPVDGEPSLDVIDESEVFSGLFDLDDIHESSGELGVGPQLSVDLDQPLLEDCLNLLGGQGVLEPIPEEQGDWHRLLHLVGARPGSDGEDTSQLVQHPGLGGGQTLHMFLRPSNHFEAENDKTNNEKFELLKLRMMKLFLSNNHVVAKCFNILS